MPDWRTYALCRGMGPDLFFTTKGESLREAKQVCNACPVRFPCLHDGMTEDFGIWGGTSNRQRRRLRGWQDARDKARVA